MKQSNILIIGNGRLARHMKHYLSLKKMVFSAWSRSEQSDHALNGLLEQAEIILLLISDNAIEPFIVKHKLREKNLKIIHCSGCLIIEGVQSAHPLQTFSNALYTISEYESIAFITEKEKEPFDTLFPALNNPFIAIDPRLKPYYHALCVMANNFTTLLWQHFFKKLEAELDISVEYSSPLLAGTLQNIQRDHRNSLTGPFSRKDFKTIEDNLKSLNQHNDLMAPIYDAFVKAYIQDTMNG